MQREPVVLVTGANGFIGTHIVEALLKRTWGELTSPGARPRTATLRFSNFDAPGATTDAPLHVVGVDLAATAGRANSARFASSVRYSFLSLESLSAALEDRSLVFDAIVHNGACSSTVETDPAVFATLNVEWSQRLWREAAARGVPFLYASSAAVYGNGAHGFSDAVEDVDRYEALNLYGRSKLDFDRWVLAEMRSGNPTPPAWFGLRYFNVYGPFESHKGGQASMVMHGYKQVVREGVMRLFRSNDDRYPDGGQQRDFLFVDDITSYSLALLSRALRAEWTEGGGRGLFVNLGTGRARTWNELASHVFASLALPERIEYTPMPPALAQQYQNFTQATHTGLERAGLPVTFTDLGQGVRTYVQRYLVRGL